MNNLDLEAKEYIENAKRYFKNYSPDKLIKLARSDFTSKKISLELYERIIILGVTM